LSVLIVIPARMKATRLPNKPLALVGGEPMIVQVWRRAVEAKLGEVIVACDGEEIASVIRAAGGVAVITDPDHPSGSDRIAEAMRLISASRLMGESPPNPPPAGSRTALRGLENLSGEYEIIVNLQGDVPTLEPRLLRELLEPLTNPKVDIATLAAEIVREEEHENPNIVKVVMAMVSHGGQPPHPLRVRGGSGWNPTQDQPTASNTGRALYFTRAAAPYGDGPRYHHIGVYAYRRAALEKFVSLPPSPLEMREKLEQLRALEAGMRIDVRVVDTVPLGVDTPEDLARANEIWSGAQARSGANPHSPPSGSGWNPTQDNNER
jgi:3-deoxy-manno-octulosonate cytidylyltransferase (CMP-KDO synthetase)